jgi:hypothetical protein
MFNVFLLWFGALFRLFRSRADLVFENFVLRQQPAVLKRRRPRPSLSIFDKLFWIAVRRSWSKWKTSAHRGHACYPEEVRMKKKLPGACDAPEWVLCEWRPRLFAIVVEDAGRRRTCHARDRAQIFVDGEEVMVGHILKERPCHDLK